ncbi:MAG TPA: ABC transporter permease [Saprospiraceae bacterium]|nr:ABC transporter permease [Saprospiraceae bacterium]HMQ82839.1 ABC transporter permease [Saprospiraceae bacterium]
MLIGVKNEQQLAEHLKQKEQLNQSYGAIVRRQFRKNRMAVWSLRLLYVLLFIALSADFIANERPLYCKLDGKTYFPVLRQYLVDVGLAEWESQFFQKSWHEHNYERVVWPLIPYSPQTIDRKNINYVGPGESQRVRSTWFRHWLGTDQLGRDVAAGMISGTRIAMLVGVISMSVATLIGVLLGALAGYFGDDRFKISRIRLILNILALFLGFFYGFSVRSYALNEGHFGWELTKSLGIIVLALFLANLLARVLHRYPAFAKKIVIPMDLIIMRIIEVFNSIPALLLLLSIVAIIDTSSILLVMAIIGLIRWTSIARFIRAELLRIRSLEYIEAAQALGFSEVRILFRHAIPNALTPVLIAIAFGIASAILLESFLSFLSIGVPPDEVTWGKLLNLARIHPSAWWLAVFPGLAIFATVTIFNLIGEGLTDALDPRLKE